MRAYNEWDVQDRHDREGYDVSSCPAKRAIPADHTCHMYRVDCPELYPHGNLDLVETQFSVFLLSGEESCREESGLEEEVLKSLVFDEDLKSLAVDEDRKILAVDEDPKILVGDEDHERNVNNCISEENMDASNIYKRDLFL